LIDRARAEQRGRLDEIESLELLRAYGVHVADARFVTRPADLADAATALGFPLVMKIVSPDVSHKSDVGGVMTSLATPGEVEKAWSRMLSTVRAHLPAASIRGVLLQRTAPAGRELIAGVTRDSSFGPLVMFGLGGVLVEALRDVVFRMAPLTGRDTREMMSALRGSRVLDGFRGQPAVDRNALEDVLGRISQLAVDFPEIAELDVNPLIAHAAGSVAADARVRLQFDATTARP
jgi:acetyl-CoA synthetase (ADP-forming)